MEQSQFEHIASKLRLKTLSVVKSCGAEADEAEDCAQDVMLRLWSVHSDIIDDHHAEALVVTLARHAIYDRRRSQRPTSSIESQKQIVDSVSVAPDDELENSENERWLRQRLRQLPNTEYEVLRMRQIEGKSVSEIASLLGITTASVSSLFVRVRKRLFDDINKRMK